MTIFYPDAEPENRDWPKKTWDLPYRTLTELRAWLREQGISRRAFKRSPAYRLAVKNGATWLKRL